MLFLRMGPITVRTRRDKNYAVLEVSDTGMGMSEEIRRRCMEPFFTTKGDNGTGLGLSMVYGIIQRHGGKIDIDSCLGKGTTFRIILPILDANIARHSQVRASLCSSLSVLVVDDDDHVREVISEYLKMDGHRVYLAMDGYEALEKFQANPDKFDVVLTDRAMPEMGGDQLINKINSIAPDKPIILVTGFGDMMAAAEEVPVGVMSILTKPLQYQQLREVLSQICAGRKTEPAKTTQIGSNICILKNKQEEGTSKPSSTRNAIT